MAGIPQPVVMIDEFGFDYGGQMDQKSAQVLRQTKLKKPDLALAVWDMRGPIPQVLAEAYRDVADLVMFESYVGNQQQYWWIASQVWSARRYGILPKTIVGSRRGEGRQSRRGLGGNKRGTRTADSFRSHDRSRIAGRGIFRRHPRIARRRRRPVRPFLPSSHRRLGAAPRGPRTCPDLFPPL